METEDKILASDFCRHHNVTLSFIEGLSDNGMIVIERVENDVFLPASQLKLAEKIVHLHFELDINLEGIETIIHLLARMEDLQSQIASLANRLKKYE
jgi:hypothetical protein